MTNLFRLFIFLICTLAISPAMADVYIRGIVRDSLTTEGLPYASVMLKGNNISTMTDSKGLFEMTVPSDSKDFSVSCQGYATKIINIKNQGLQIYDIYLSPEAKELEEIIVKKQKYSKKNNPAVDFAKALREGRHLTDPTRKPDYSYSRYERMSLGINDFNSEDETRILKRFPFLIEHVDTSELSGKPVLSLSVKEKASDVYYKNGQKKELVKGVRSQGVDEILGEENTREVLEDFLREIDLFDGDISLLHNNFVGPFSKIAPDFYKFYLTDTVEINNRRCIVLAFYPRNAAAHAFSGHVFVEEGDSAMFIRRADMKIPHGSNINHIEELAISQTFDKAPDGSRLKTTDDVIMTMKFLPGTPSAYLARKITFTDHSFEEPQNSMAFNFIGESLLCEDADEQTDLFWSSVSSRPIQQGESRVGQLMHKLRDVKLFYWGEKILKVLVNGYISTAKDSKFDIGPVNTTASYNSLEGLRLRAGGITTANLSKNIFARGYVAYGFKEQKLKYSAEFEYSFNKKKYHSREFPIHSLRLIHSYDVDRLGSHYLFTNADNFVLSVERLKNNKDTYRRLTSVEYTLELNNHFSVAANIRNIRQAQGPDVRFVDYYNVNYAHFTQTLLELQLRFAPGEKFYQAKSYRVPINDYAPVFSLQHVVGIKGLGSKFNVNKTEFHFNKKFSMSLFGSAEIALGAGHVWSKGTPFTELLVPNANLSYIIQPQSFELMNPLEFINSTYASWDITYRMEGLILNQIPGIKKLGLREIVGFRGLWGNLNRSNTPGENNPSLFIFPDDTGIVKMDNGPYMEISAGLDNVFRILRLEYVWRLSYLNVPYEIDRHGLRLAMHFSF